MNTGQALLAAILADPDDDTVRLAYADFLAENGDEARAEFIRVQVELGVWCNRDHPREQVILNATPAGQEVPNRVRWFAVDPNPAHLWWDKFRPDYRRGFVESVTCTWADWRDNATAILANHPVREVTIPERPSLALHIGEPFSRARLPRCRTWFPYTTATGLPPADLWGRMMHYEYPRITFHLPAA